MSVVTNWAVQLSGGIQTGNSSDSTISDGQTTFSVSFWLKFVAIATSSNLMSIIGGNPGWVVVSSGNSTSFLVNFADFSSDSVNGVQNVADGSWHNIICVYDATSGVDLKIYIDGVLKGHTHDSSPTSTNYDSGVPIYIGPAQSSNTFRMDDARYYNVALTATDATNLATGNEISTSNRKSYWAFEEGSGNTAADTSGSGNDITFTPSAIWTTDTPVPPLVHGSIPLNLSDSVVSADQLAKKVFRGLADTASPPTDVLVKQPDKHMLEPTLSVDDSEAKITARRLDESITTGDWNEQEKNPAQNVWTDF